MGPGGKTIKRISAETGAQIDIQQDGKVFVAAVNQEAGRAAVDIIQSIVGEIEIGSVFTGKVTRLLGIGAFVEFAPGREGLVHISQLRVPTPRRPDDVVSVGDEIKVKVFEVDGQGRINLTALNLDNSFAPGIVEAPPQAEAAVLAVAVDVIETEAETAIETVIEVETAIGIETVVDVAELHRAADKADLEYSLHLPPRPNQSQRKTKHLSFVSAHDAKFVN